MIIRKAKLKDINECVSLSKIKEFEYPLGFPDKESLTNSLDKIFLVVEEDNKVIGFILGYPLTQKLVYLDLMTVHKNYRGKGIGQKLIKTFKEELKKRGVKEYLLFTPSFNKRTINFYQKKGLKKGKQYTLFCEDI